MAYFILDDNLRDQLNEMIHDGEIFDKELDEFRHDLGIKFSEEGNFDKFLELEIDIEEWLKDNDVKIKAYEQFKYPFKDAGLTGMGVLAEAIKETIGIRNSRVLCKDGPDHTFLLTPTKPKRTMILGKPIAYAKIWIDTNRAENNNMLNWHEKIIKAVLKSYGWTGSIQNERGFNYISLESFDPTCPEAMRFQAAIVNYGHREVEQAMDDRDLE